MDIYEGILEAAERELESVANKGKFSSEKEVHCVYELVGIARRIHAIWAYEEPQAEEGGLFSRISNAGGSYEGGSYEGGSYEGGSYRNSRRGNSRRMSREGGSYRNSRGDEKSFIEKMKKMRDEAPDEQTRMEIDNLLAQMG